MDFDNIEQIGEEASWHDVNKKWIIDRMQEYDIRSQSYLAEQAGINKSSLSDWLNGKREVAESAKPTLWHFFNYLALKQEIKKLNRWEY